MNTPMLLAEIKLKGLSMGEFLKRIQMLRGTWSKKINGISEFKQSEINDIISVLGLSDEKTMSIFLRRKLPKRNKKNGCGGDRSQRGEGGEGMESVTCPHCGAVVRRGNFCSRCSGKLVEVCDCWVKKKAYNCGRDECPGVRLHRLELEGLPH